MKTNRNEKKQYERIQYGFDCKLLDLKIDNRNMVAIIHMVYVVVAMLAFVMQTYLLVVVVSIFQYGIVLLKGRALLGDGLLTGRTKLLTKNLYFPITKIAIMKSKGKLLARRFLIECLISACCIPTMTVKFSMTKIVAVYVGVVIGFAVAAVQLIATHYSELQQ
ncbi:hypothetical protein lbkm_4247 [Lachnospiraceae bacterium KM106-2]|nr:hypothetical protein lbkm_4247 [Lachnospiraceae bacterium KM106-2]